MPERKTYTGEISFVLQAVMKWVLAAVPALVLVTFILSVSKADAMAFGYASSAVSFAAAVAAGAAAIRTRGRGGLVTGLIAGAVITTLLLMTGFIIAGSDLGPDGVLSVAAFTLSGCAAGSVLLRDRGRKRKKRRTR